MGKVKPEGYADVPVLQKQSAEIIQAAEADMTDESVKEKILALCHELADVLKPFTLVHSTNERWRDEMSEVASKVQATAEALEIEDPVLETLAKGAKNLRRYRMLIQSAEVSDEIAQESMMDPQTMGDAIVQALDQFAASIDRDPHDEWQLKKNMETVKSLCNALSYKIGNYYHEDQVCARAGGLMTRVAEVMDAAAQREDVSVSLQNLFIRSANGARKLKGIMDRAVASSKEREEEMIRHFVKRT